MAGIDRTLRVGWLGLALAAALGLGACASNRATDLAGSALGAGAAAPGSAQDFAATAGDRVFFDSDSTQLTPTATATLDKQAAWLARYPRLAVTIEGHADERGTREYNFQLGASRAQAARDYLVARGVDAGRVRTTSFGKERPVAVCNDISCWSQNRRAVTVLGGAAGA